MASAERARAAGWRPVHDTLEEIVAIAYAWGKAHLDGYGA